MSSAPPPPPVDYFVPPSPALVAVCVVYCVLFTVLLAWYLARRHLQPLKARGLLLTLISMLFGTWHFVILVVINQNPVSSTFCPIQRLNVISSSLFLPLWAIPIMMRGALLVFVMNVNRAKISLRTTSWLHRLRPYVESTAAQLALIGFFAALQLGLTYGLPNSGRLPGDYGPCALSVDVYITGAFGAFYLVVLAVISFFAYWLDDIYAIKRELTIELFLGVSCLALWVIASSRLISVSAGIFVMIVIATSAVNILLVPILISYREYWSHFNIGALLRGSSSDETKDIYLDQSNDTSDELSTAKQDGAPKPAPLVRGGSAFHEDTRLIQYLRHPEFMSEFKRFCVRAFCAETVTFFNEIQRKDEIARMDQPRRMEECRKIYVNFIVPGGPMELNLTDPVRQQVTAAHQQRPDDMNAFDIALRETYWLMKTSLFPAWKQDAAFIRLRQKPGINVGSAGSGLELTTVKVVETPAS